MDERKNKRLRPEDFVPNDPAAEAKKRKKLLKRLLSLTLLLLVVLGIVLAAAYWDLNSFDSLRRRLSYNKVEQDEQGKARLYTYSSDRTDLFAAFSDRLLIASTTSIRLLGEGGEELYNESIPLEHPAIAVGKNEAAVYDVGGSALYLFDRKGFLRDMSVSGGGIISVSLNVAGHLALTTKQSGCKSQVSVFDNEGAERFTFRSSEYYVSDAFVLPDGGHLALTALTEKDGSFASEMQFYSLSSETPNAARSIEGSLVLEARTVDNSVMLVSDDCVAALSLDGRELGRYQYELPYLRGYDFGGRDFAALVLSRYRSGYAGRIVSVGANGKMIAALDTGQEILDISAAGSYLAVLYSNSLTIYTRDLNEYALLTGTDYASGVFMREDGTALLTGETGAWLFIP